MKKLNDVGDLLHWAIEFLGVEALYNSEFNCGCDADCPCDELNQDCQLAKREICDGVSKDECHPDCEPEEGKICRVPHKYDTPTGLTNTNNKRA